MISNPPDISVLDAREKVDHALQSAWTSAAMESSPLALLLVAFDGGDRAAVAQTVNTLERALRVHCGRSRDIVLRRHHDKFLALLPDTPPAGARRVGEQILEAMHAGDSSATVSVGVAVSVPDDQQSATNLLRRAESALRSAQNHGGDRCLGGSTKTVSPTAPSALTWLRKQVQSGSKSGERRRRD